MISPMHIEGITNVDLYMMLVSTIMIWFFSFTKYTIEAAGGEPSSCSPLAATCGTSSPEAGEVVVPVRLRVRSARYAVFTNF